MRFMTMREGRRTRGMSASGVRRWGLWVLTAVASGLGGAARADDPADSILSPLGVVDNRLFDEAADAGADWMRVPIQWKYIERGDDNFTFGAESNWLDNLEARNMHMSPVVNIGRCWASHRAGDEFDPNDDPGTIADYPSRAPSDLRLTYSSSVAYSETYYDFIFTLLTQYGDRIDRLTIENEVNARNFWEDSIADYLKVLTTARKAAMDANPNVLIFESGMGSGSWGAPIAKDRYDDAEWSWITARNWLRDYYDRDVFVRTSSLMSLWSVANESQMQAWFNDPIVTDNYTRVTTVLDNLFSAELGVMLVDGLNVKFTGDPWLLPEVITWIDERIAAAGQPPLPVKINNEASSWCINYLDYDGEECALDPGDFPLLADEMVKKILYGLDVGVVQSVWFPLSNERPQNEATPRLGLYDYSGNPTDALDAYRLLGRFIGGNRDFVGRTTIADSEQFSFNERVLDRDDVHVLYFDDGNHGAGTTSTTLTVPEGTIVARHYTVAGDSTDLVVSGGQVSVPIDERPSIVYFDDGITPIQGEIEPTHAPVPATWALGAPSPNPSSGRVSVGFGLPRPARDVRIDIFDVTGRRVVPLYEGALGAGTYRLRWDGVDVSGRPVADGVYFFRLRGSGFSDVRKLLISR